MKKFLALLLCLATPVFGQMKAPAGGVPSADFVTSTNLSEARQLDLVAATNTLEAACNAFFAKDLVLVAFTNKTVTTAMTNGWDVSSGGGGGGNADDTNYWGVLAFGSNDWQTMANVTTNSCIFSLEVADFGNVCNPATGHFTIRKSGWWEGMASWWMAHPIDAAKQGIFSMMTNNVHWISDAKSGTSDGRLETTVYRVHDRAYLLSGTVVRCTFYHNSGGGRVSGGDTDLAAHTKNVSTFMMDFIQE